MRFFKQTKTSIGYDLGSKDIKIAILEHGKAGARVQQLIRMPLAEGIIVEGIIFDERAMVERLQLTLSLVDVRNATVVTGVSSVREAIVRYNQTLQRAPLHEARAQLQNDKTLVVSVRPEEAIYDLVIVDPDGTGPMMKAVVVTSRKDYLIKRQRVFREAMIPLHVLDVDAFGLFNIFEICHPDLAERDITLVHIGWETELIVACTAGVIVATRQMFAAGTKYLIEAIENSGRIVGGEAEEVLQSDVLHTIHGDIFKQWVGVAADYVRSVVESRPNGEGNPLQNVYLSGEGAMIPRIAEAMASELGTSVSVFDPLKSLDVADEIKSRHENDGPIFALALGYAFRGTVT